VIDDRRSAMATKKAKSDDQALLDEFKALKKLFILSLLADGISQTDIARTLSVDQSTISKMVPMPTIKRESKR